MTELNMSCFALKISRKTKNFSTITNWYNNTLIPIIHSLFFFRQWMQLDDDDIILVANSWWSKGHTARPYMLEHEQASTNSTSSTVKCFQVRCNTSSHISGHPSGTVKSAWLSMRAQLSTRVMCLRCRPPYLMLMQVLLLCYVQHPLVGQTTPSRWEPTSASILIKWWKGIKPILNTSWYRKSVVEPCCGTHYIPMVATFASWWTKEGCWRGWKPWWHPLTLLVSQTTILQKRLKTSSTPTATSHTDALSINR